MTWGNQHWQRRLIAPHAKWGYLHPNKRRVSTFTRTAVSDLATTYFSWIGPSGLYKISKSPNFIYYECHTFLNNGKAHWPEFREFSNRHFRELLQPPDVRVAEFLQPNCPAEAAMLTYESDGRSSINPSVSELTMEDNWLVQEHAKKNWLEHLKGCNNGINQIKLVVRVKSLSMM